MIRFALAVIARAKKRGLSADGTLFKFEVDQPDFGPLSEKPELWRVQLRSIRLLLLVVLSLGA